MKWIYLILMALLVQGCGGSSSDGGEGSKSEEEAESREQVSKSIIGSWARECIAIDDQFFELGIEVHDEGLSQLGKRDLWWKEFLVIEDSDIGISYEYSVLFYLDEDCTSIYPFENYYYYDFWSAGSELFEFSSPAGFDVILNKTGDRLYYGYTGIAVHINDGRLYKVELIDPYSEDRSPNNFEVNFSKYFERQDN